MHTPTFLSSPVLRRRRAVLLGCFALAIVQTPQVFAQAASNPASAAVRLRGTIERLSPERLVLRERSGERIEFVLPGNLVMTEVFPVSISDIRDGSFIGVGAMPQADGTQRAIAVTLFPEAQRGTGEGHRPFNFLPQSTMTNATVAGIASAPDGRRLKVTYKDGEKTIVVPPDAPVVSMRPGSRDLLVVGAGVTLSAQTIDGKPTATRISAGQNGFTPPY